MKTKLILETPAQALSARHEPGVCFRCHDCGEAKPVQHSGGTGYARCKDTDGTEHLVCYACTDNRERAAMLTENRFTAYVSCDGRRLQTWSGGDLGSVSFGERHPWSSYGDRKYVRAYDVHGQTWHGTGAPGMYCNLKKCKS